MGWATSSIYKDLSHAFSNIVEVKGHAHHSWTFVEVKGYAHHSPKYLASGPDAVLTIAVNVNFDCMPLLILSYMMYRAS